MNTSLLKRLKSVNVSFIFSAVALALSWSSLKTNQTSVIVGQRAYVAVENAQVYVKPLVSIATSAGTANLRIITCSMVLKNAGNTPAKFLNLQAKITTPEDWRVVNADSDRQRPGPIGPRSDRPWTFSEAVSLTTRAATESVDEAEKVRAWHEYKTSHMPLEAKFQPRPQVYIDFTLTYEDVFGGKETLTWRSSEVL